MTTLKKLHTAILCILLAIFCQPAAADSQRLPGKFVWADLVTYDGKAAEQFFREWLGWQFRAQGDVDLIIHQDRTLGAIRQRPQAPGTPVQPRWVGYISVADVKASAQKVATMGGKPLLPAQTHPSMGEFAVMADAEGAVFGLIRRADDDPEDYLAEPGEWIWMQLFCRDIARATAFYQAAGGYELYALDASRGARQLLVKDGYARASISVIPPGEDAVAPAWLPFVRVEDINAALQKVAALGGRILMTPDDEKLEGKVAIVADPTGAALGVLEWHAEEGSAMEQMP